MGEGKRSLRDLLRKADAGEVYTRTHETVGIGRDRYGREHPADLPTLRDEQDEGGSQPSSQGQETKIQFLGIEEIKDTITVWKGKPMEKTHGRNNSPSEYNWRGFLESAQKGMEAASVKDGDPILNAHKISNIASSLYDMKILPVDVARIIHCAALMHASQDPVSGDRHRRVIATAATLGELSRMNGDADLSQLRVVTELANQLAGVQQA